MSLIFYLIIGGAIGWFAGILLGKGIPGGVIGTVIAGIIGAWIGTGLLGNWGPKLSDFYIIPATIGALIFVFLVSYLMKSMHRPY